MSHAISSRNQKQNFARTLRYMHFSETRVNLKFSIFVLEVVLPPFVPRRQSRSWGKSIERSKNFWNFRFQLHFSASQNGHCLKVFSCSFLSIEISLRFSWSHKDFILLQVQRISGLKSWFLCSMALWLLPVFQRKSPVQATANVASLALLSSRSRHFSCISCQGSSYDNVNALCTFT